MQPTALFYGFLAVKYFEAGCYTDTGVLNIAQSQGAGEEPILVANCIEARDGV